MGTHCHTGQGPDGWIEQGLALRREMRMQEAIDAYSAGLCQFPFHPLLYRHRGHAYINLGQYRMAAADFALSLRLNPDNWDCWYHLGLAYYLLEDYEAAERAYDQCLERSADVEQVAPVVDWLYLTLGQADRQDEAEALLERIGTDWDIRDNTGYYQRLLVYKGVLSPGDVVAAAAGQDDHTFATTCYGIAWHLIWNGEAEQGMALMGRICERSSLWTGFAERAAKRDMEMAFKGKENRND